MKAIRQTLIYVIMMAACLSCHKPKPEAEAVAPEPEQTETTLELPFPEPPSSLSTPEERAAYILAHFWDELDFTDTVRSHNEEFMEQNFSNFISVFPFADEEGRIQGVKELMKRSEKDSVAHALVAETAYKYLYDPNSPMLNEDFYIPFLEEEINSSATGEVIKMRLRKQLHDVQKNRPGMVASNFSYKNRNGKTSTLYKTQSSNDLLLIFYDPDCDHCDEAIKTLLGDDALQELIKEGQLTVMAIYSGDNEKQWRKTYGKFPEEWIVGYESGKIDDDEIYVLRATPTIFLLDRDKKVVLKDVPVATLLTLLHQSYG